MAWGTRPKISNKLGIPTPREGSDGDTQIRQTNLGAKLYGKIGGRWYSAALTAKEGDVTTRIGTTLSNHLAISSDKLEFMKDSKSMLSISNTGDINMSGKINITSSGTQNICMGTWTGNPDVSGANNNVVLGVNAGNAIESGALDNICIGTQAGQTITTGDKNIMIGTLTGDGASNDVTTGLRNIMIGYGSSPSGNTSDETVIGGLDQHGVTTTGNGQGTATISCPSGLYIGSMSYNTGFKIVNRRDTDTGFYQGSHYDRFYCIAGDETVWEAYETGGVATLRVHSYLDLLEKSADPTEPDEGHAKIWMSDGSGKGDDGDVIIASQAGGTTKYSILFDHSGGSSW